VASSSVYSKRFAALSLFTGTVSVTVPAGKVWILRDVDVVNRNSATASFGIEGSSGQLLWYLNPVYNPNELWAGWRGRQIFSAGDTIGFSALTGVWDCTASGYELLSP
jgi:hypothetical protein